MSYKIITDSCCDFTRQQYADLGLAFAPLTLVYKGKSIDGFTEPDELHAFYDSIREGEMPTTSAVNPDGWERLMRPVLEQGEDVLCLAFSSALSTTYQSAVIAANDLKEEFPGRTINVVDTRCAALGQGLLAWHACKRRDQGMNLAELTAWVEENKHHLAHWVTVDDLNHLKRGGRVSATTALVGTMLNIKPIIHVDDEGRLINTHKVRGRSAAMNYIAAKLGELGEGYDNETVFIAHGDCPEDAAALEALVKEKYGVKNVYTGYVGPVIGAHTGPGVLVVFFMGKNR